MAKFSTKEIKSLDELLKIAKQSSIKYNITLIKKAFKFAEKKHYGQKRLSGDKYIIHPLTVAFFITQLKLDTLSICAALLHDVIEKTDCDINELDSNFGTEVAFIVEGVSKIKSFSKSFDKSEKQNEFTELIFNSSEDIRIIIIKIAEKLHNLKTSNYLSKEKQLQSAKRALYIYAPIAEYLDLGTIQRLLEDYSFKITHKTVYLEIKNSIDEFFKSKQNLINKFEVEIKELLREYKIDNYEMISRQKGIYSAYKKLKTKYNYVKKNLTIQKAIENYLKDIYAARIIVDSVENCYIVLGLVQSNFEHLPEEYTDYISQPKENGYKSIHVLFKFGSTVFEVQIRTFEMNEHAEYGPASHIAYKLQDKNKTYTWTKELMEWQDKTELSKEDFKINSFKNSVFCFTPKGLVISLRKGCSPIDFAYKVHTQIGDRYEGAIINGKMRSMDYELKTGDIVEIIIGNKVNVTRNWLNNTKNRAARSQIRKTLRSIKTAKN